MKVVGFFATVWFGMSMLRFWDTSDVRALGMSVAAIFVLLLAYIYHVEQRMGR